MLFCSHRYIYNGMLQSYRPLFVLGTIIRVNYRVKVSSFATVKQYIPKRHNVRICICNNYIYTCCFVCIGKFVRVYYRVIVRCLYKCNSKDKLQG